MGTGFKISCLAILIIVGLAYTYWGYIISGTLRVNFSIFSFVFYALDISIAALIFFHLESITGEKPTVTMGEKFTQNTEGADFVTVKPSKKELDGLGSFLEREKAIQYAQDAHVQYATLGKLQDLFNTPPSANEKV